MQRKSMILTGMVCAVLALSACDRKKDPQLLNVKSNQEGGPDEFAILPSKPLTLPVITLRCLPRPKVASTARM